MGREAECDCQCNGVRSRVKALIEPPELILRGALLRRLPFSALQEIRAEGESLLFRSGSETFSLATGRATAQKWVKALTTPPPTLSSKLGISGNTVVKMIGAVDDDALRDALSLAKAVNGKNPDLILARVGSAEELASALRASAKQLAARVPIWFIYAKGRGQGLTENEVRSTALAAGIVDTKVAAISPALTGLRFVRRRDE
jgi:hypothetical protein